MPAVCFYFQVHQPRRIKDYRAFDIGVDHAYFDASDESDRDNVYIMQRVAEKCYLPANALFLQLLEAHPEMRISFSFSGIFLEQIERDFPAVLASFQALVQTGRVEILAETYYHSLAFLYSEEEFEAQVALHAQKVRELFGVVPRVFRNTELIYSNALAEKVAAMGYTGILTEGADRILGTRSAHHLYTPPDTEGITTLLKSYRLSDDIAFRFSEKTWPEHPLSAARFAQWIQATGPDAEIINLFMDYETFGEHQWADAGIFDFLAALPAALLSDEGNRFVTPSEAIQTIPVRDTIDVPTFISWADEDRDLSAWLSNDLQKDAIQKLYDLQDAVMASKDPTILRDWRRLQTSDHFYYMCTKWHADGDVHTYFSPYETPYDAFIVYINALNDLKLRIDTTN